MSTVVATRIPERSWRSEARAVQTVWRREMIRFFGDRMHMLMWLVQPLLFLFVLGSGLQTLSAASTGGVDLKTFVFPGVLCMAATFTGIFTAASIVWDRELGFLRELLVAPVSRTSILLGKCLGGTTAAVTQGAILLALSGLVGVPYDPALILGVFALLVLTSFTVTAFGVLVAVRIKRPQTFTYVSQMFVMPMFFVSGAFFPVTGLPDWLRVLNRIDPLTYAVDAIRQVVFDHLDVTAAARETLAPSLGSPVLEAAVVLGIGVALLALAIRSFARTS